MGTPLKSLQTLLSPRLLSPLSPLSPNLLSVPTKHGKFLNTTNKLLVEGNRLSNAAKRLEFSQQTSPKCLVETVKLKVTDYDYTVASTEHIVINTPNKKNLFERGIEGYENEKHLLGKGSFGKVLRGIHKGKTVAVKVVKKKCALGEKNALNLCHENIVKTIEVVEKQEGNFSLVIMEYFPDSKQLQSLLQDSNFSMENKMVSFAKDICCGLNCIHGKSILHLDIKPHNVLVVENVCKICDFGNSVHINDVESFHHHGTVVYTAPELLQGKKPTEKCDVYSLGVLLWQLKTRSFPYSDIDNVETVIYKVVKCNCRPENSFAADNYTKLYQKCWEKDPNKRPNVSNIYLQLNSI